MPFIRITTIGPTLTPDQIESLQRGVTEIMSGVMRKPMLSIAVLVDQVTHGSWSIAGEQVRKAAHIECAIGVNTNTPSEKSEFMSRAIKLLNTTLGLDVPDVTYTIVNEYAHDTYGRGGLSRSQREKPGAAV